jgi:uncharacterized protein with GYD domain
MPVYVTLMKLTDQGIKTIKDSPQRIAENVKALEDAGGKLLAFYMTLGEYDYVSIQEVPSDEVGAALLLKLAGGGTVRTTTLKAFTKEQFAEIVKKLP